MTRSTIKPATSACAYGPNAVHAMDAMMFSDARNRQYTIKYKGNTNRKLCMVLHYGASPATQARKYGRRNVRLAQKMLNIRESLDTSFIFN